MSKSLTLEQVREVLFSVNLDEDLGCDNPNCQFHEFGDCRECLMAEFEKKAEVE